MNMVFSRPHIDLRLLFFIAVGLNSCNTSVQLATDIPIAALPASFESCMSSISALKDRDAVACLYVEGATRVLESRVVSACSNERCDFGSWTLGAPGGKSPSGGSIPFSDPATLRGDIPARLVLFGTPSSDSDDTGLCPSPSSPIVENVTGPDFECLGSSLIDTTPNDCFTSFPIPVSIGDDGLNFALGAAPEFFYSSLFEAEVSQQGDSFSAVCASSQSRQRIGPPPQIRQLQLTLQGSGTGSVVADNLDFTCAKTGPSSQLCTADVFGGTQVNLIASSGTETRTSWDDSTCISDGSRCRVSIGNDSDGPVPVVLNLPLNRYPLTINLLETGFGRAPGDVRSTTLDANGDEVHCGPSPATCTFEFEYQTAVELTAIVPSSADNFAFTTWSSPCPDDRRQLNCPLVITQSTTVSATFEAGVFPLQVNVRGLGAVEEPDRAAGEPAIRCGPAISAADQQVCNRVVRQGEVVRLVARASNGTGEAFRTFATTEGLLPCSNAGAECAFTVGGRVDLQAIFTFPVSISSLVGEGSIASSPSRLSCSTGLNGICSERFDFGTNLELSATADPSATFIAWSEGLTELTSQPSYNLQVVSARNFNAVFGHTLVTTVVDDGDLTIYDGTSTRSCTSQGTTTNCNFAFPDNTALTLTAQPRTGSTLVGWFNNPSCTSTSMECMLNINTNQDVRARFAYQLEASISGNGLGLVTGGGLNCSPDGSGCVATQPSGSQFQLRAEASSGYGWLSWAGDCAGAQSPNCDVLIAGPKSPRAPYRFDAEFGCMVNVSISGRGSVSSTPTGLGTGNPTMGTFPCGSSVSLLATPGTNSPVPVWFGPGTEACGTANTCAITPTAGQAVSLRFSQPLSISSAPIGTGNRVTTQNTSVLDCPSTCNALITDNTSVTLIAVPGTGFRFDQWPDGPCAGSTSPICTFDMNQPRTMSPPNFVRQVILSIDAVGAPGNVDINLGATNAICSTEQTCRYTVDSGTQVILNGTATSGGMFIGFDSIECPPGLNECTLTINADTTVRATFHEALRVQFESDGISIASGSCVRSTSPTGIDACIGEAGEIQLTALPGTQVILQATPNAVVNFDGWFDPGSGTLISTRSTESFALNRGVGTRVVRARFNESWGITVQIQDASRGRITAIGINNALSNCTHLSTPGQCELRLPRTLTSVTLHATPSTDGVGWSTNYVSGCNTGGGSSNDCTVNFDASQQQRVVQVRFVYPISFAQNVMDQAISNSGCPSCHVGPNGLARASNLFFAEGNINNIRPLRDIYDELVCQNCTTSDCCNILQERVTNCLNPPSGGIGTGRIRLPDDNPDNSYLLQMPLTESPDFCLNHGGSIWPTTTNNNYVIVRDWIRGGAPFN